MRTHFPRTTNFFIAYFSHGDFHMGMVALPICHGENAFAWLKAHFPDHVVLAVHKAFHQ